MSVKVINWFLNIGANILLILIIVSMMHGMASKDVENAFPAIWPMINSRSPIKNRPILTRCGRNSGASLY
jgi:hypothetical protein